MKTTELRDRLLVAGLLEARKERLDGFLSPKEVADGFGLVRLPGQLRLIIDDLERRGMIRATKVLVGGDEGGMDFRFTSAGVEAAENLLELHPEYGAQNYGRGAFGQGTYGTAEAPEAVPAADRYVTLDDNRKETVIIDLGAVREAMRGVNGAAEEDRLVALSELAAFEVTITQQRVATELIERFVNKVLSWLVKVFTAAAVSDAAKALIKGLAGLILRS